MPPGRSSFASLRALKEKEGDGGGGGGGGKEKEGGYSALGEREGGGEQR